jgi:hypothetical protein
MMIRYTVVWREDVQNDLASLWLNSPIRQQITAAADGIDTELLIDAHLKGEDSWREPQEDNHLAANSSLSNR